MVLLLLLQSWRDRYAQVVGWDGSICVVSCGIVKVVVFVVVVCIVLCW